MLSQSFLLRGVLPEMILLKRAQKSFCSNKLSVIGAGSEKTCTTNNFASKNSFIKEATFPQSNARRIGPDDRYEIVSAK